MILLTSDQEWMITEIRGEIAETREEIEKNMKFKEESEFNSCVFLVFSDVFYFSGALWSESCDRR